MLQVISALHDGVDLNHIPPRILPSAGTIKLCMAFVQQPLLYVRHLTVITIIAVVICITAGCMASHKANQYPV